MQILYLYPCLFSRCSSPDKQCKFDDCIFLGNYSLEFSLPERANMLRDLVLVRIGQFCEFIVLSFAISCTERHFVECWIRLLIFLSWHNELWNRHQNWWRHKDSNYLDWSSLPMELFHASKGPKESSSEKQHTLRGPKMTGDSWERYSIWCYSGLHVSSFREE